jgi:thiamine transport system substrate-binding protein
MSTGSVASAPSGPRRRSRRAGRWVTTIAAVAVVLVVAVAAYAVVQYVQSRPSETQLVVYTYPTLFNGNCGASPNLSAVLAPFEAAHDVEIDFECPAGTLVSTLLAQKSAPQADLVIGLDEVTTPEAEANGLLVPYVSPQLAHVDPNVTRELSSDGGATPYEWGYLGIDYNLSFAQSTGTSVADLSFPSLASNLSLAHGLVVEDPTTDIVGEEFLLWEIEFYETVLHESWQSWWQSVDPALQFAPDWGSAFSEFDGGPGSPPMVVSYTTDPGYAVEYGQAHQYNSTATLWNGSEYGWRSVYGIGIVQGTRHLTLDQELVDWFLGGTVQSQIPLNEWEYPANRTIGIPSVFDANPDPTDFVPLDDATSPAQIALDLPGYLETWQSIDNSAG